MLGSLGGAIQTCFQVGGPGSPPSAYATLRPRREARPQMEARRFGRLAARRVKHFLAGFSSDFGAFYPAADGAP